MRKQNVIEIGLTDLRPFDGPSGLLVWASPPNWISFNDDGEYIGFPRKGDIPMENVPYWLLRCIRAAHSDMDVSLGRVEVFNKRTGQTYAWQFLARLLNVLLHTDNAHLLWEGWWDEIHPHADPRRYALIIGRFGLRKPEHVPAEWQEYMQK